MIFFKRQKPIEKKENPVGASLYLETRGRTREKNIETYIKEGYVQNVIVYRCIREITTALGSVDIDLRSGDTEIENHKALELIGRPNPTESWPQFIRHAFADYLISGNMFIGADTEIGPPRELWVLSPTKMHVEGAPSGMPMKFIYQGQPKKEFPVDQITGQSQVFHLKTYNPESPFIGMSPMRHVALSADTHNAGLKWNSSLLENGARPSGIIKFKGTPGDEVVSALREYFKKALQGANNAGEVPMLTEDAEWQEVSINPKDMDFSATMATMAKYIASAYGVPLPLIDNDSASFNNVKQAKERLWTDTVLPLLDEFLEGFSNWLLPRFAENLRFVYDADSIPALEEVRAQRSTRLQVLTGAPIITVNEARSELGYGEDASGVADALLTPSSMIPSAAVSDGTNTTDVMSPPASDVQATVLNGAQITALQQIVQSVADGQLPSATAEALIAVAFPSLTPAEISKIVKPASNFTPNSSDPAAKMLKGLGYTDAEIKDMAEGIIGDEG